MSKWLDSHCHINGREYYDDLDSVLDNMVFSDVSKCMIVSLNTDEFDYSLKINHPDIEFKRSIGIYPEDVDKYSLEDFRPYYEKADAIGEIGLDYYWTKENISKQKEIFIEQMKIANSLNKPVIIHSREAMKDTYDILKEYRNRGVLHCYSGSKEMAREFVKLGYYISFAGVITFKNAKEPLEVAKNIPLDHMLIETDSPYLTPVPKRGKCNEPANVVYTGRFICENLGIDENEFKDIINSNYDRLFGGK